MKQDSTPTRGTRIQLPLTPLQRIVVDLACMSSEANREGRYTDAWRLDRAINEIMPIAKRDQDAGAAPVVAS